MKRIVISAGPIPAKLDSVKFITNRFKGGLAFKAAMSLIDSKKYDVTIVKWVYTDLPKHNILYSNYWESDSVHVVSVNDVVEYYNWYKNNAKDYDAFIMSAAVANLMPSNPYEGKFPSHNYKVGEKFNIKFQIAPRAIDVVKQINPKACLIGYKLFDAKSNDELIEIAKHTLIDSKANVIFANTPSMAKEKKIAVTQDGAAIPMSFDEHIEFINKAIDAEYFTTKTIDEPISKSVEPYLLMVEHYEKTFNGFGTVAFRVPDGGIVTTSRGHKNGAVYVKDIDYKTKTIYTNKKATLNAPLLFSLLANTHSDYVVHRHETKPYKVYEYEFPGTVGELSLVQKCINDKCHAGFCINHHGYIECKTFSDVNWDKYYDTFPKKYFPYPEVMDVMLDSFKQKETLEIGGNASVKTKYSLDKYVKSDKAINITYDDLKTKKFDLILLKNSITYLSEDELRLVIGSLSNGGVILANSFRCPPSIKVTDNEIAYEDSQKIHHFLFCGDDVFYHTFNAYDEKLYKKLGFKCEPYGKNSIIIEMKK